MGPRAGAIPASIGNLTHLKELNLRANSLSGACVLNQVYPTNSRARAQAPSRRPSATSQTCRCFISTTTSSPVRVLNQFNTQVVLLTAMRLARSRALPLSHKARAQRAAAQLRQHLHLKSETTQLRSRKERGWTETSENSSAPVPEKANTRRAAKKATTRRREI